MAETQSQNVYSLETGSCSEFSDEIAKKTIAELIQKFPFNYMRMIKAARYCCLLNWIMEKTKFTAAEWLSTKSRIYMALNDMTELPTCKYCGKIIERNVIDVVRGFRDYCDSKCANLDPMIKKKIEESNLKKYGVRTASASPVVQQKRRITCMRKYGVDNASKTEAVREKMKNTCMERYGTDSYSKTAECREKMKNTCLERYGVEYSTQTERMKRASRKTCMEKYGVQNAGGAPEVLSKIRKSNLERHGVEYPQQNKEISEKRKNTCLERYGVIAPYDQDFVKRQNADRIKRWSFEHFIANNAYDEPMFSIDDYVQRASIKDELEFRCKKCGNTFKTAHHDGCHSKCPICFPTPDSGVSQEEKDLFTFVKQIYDGEIIQGTREVIAPYELDVYVPEKKLAIEFDGIFWHSAACKDDGYHLMKTKMCSALGIKLVHVFESEWQYKSDIVKSRLAAALGVIEKRIFARNCSALEINESQSFAFQERNHMQGGVHSKVNFGLLCDSELVGVMTFSKPRFSKKHEWELVRFCTKTGVQLVGGASKLLKAFERKYFPKSIVSYADRRWSDGKLYYALGFRHVKNTRPSPWYFRNGSMALQSRIKFQKHKLAKVLENFDPEKTEFENMIENGYNAIYDCGSMTFEKEY